MNVKTSATLALFGTVIIWSLFAVIARVTVARVSPMMLLFLRFGIACIAFSPFLVKYKPWSKKNFGRLVVISLFSTINVAVFILGIQFTSASASQLIYAAMPILIIVYHMLFQKMRYPRAKILGVIIGFSGILYIVYLSSIEKGTTISGSLIGNICIVGAMMGWMTYLLMSKKLTTRFTPVEIGSVSILVSFAVSGILAVFEIITKRAFFELDVADSACCVIYGSICYIHSIHPVSVRSEAYVCSYRESNILHPAYRDNGFCYTFYWRKAYGSLFIREYIGLFGNISYNHIRSVRQA